jgi:hypothetical protein
VKVDEWTDAPPATFREAWQALREDLRAWGVDDRHIPVVFFCLPRVTLAQDPGHGFPNVIPASLRLDESEAEAHFEALVDLGCLIIEMRGFGIVDGCYLVALDHAWNIGYPSTDLIATGIRHPRPKLSASAAVDVSHWFAFGSVEQAVPPCPSLDASATRVQSD